LTPLAAREPWPPALDILLQALADPRAPISRASRRRARDVHIRDSLSGLELEQLRAARRIADLGSGAGLPGLALAAALPEAEVELIESSARKCEFARETIERMGLSNAVVVCERAEDWARSGRPAGEGGREAYDAVTARAVGGLAELAELASPLLVEGGWLAAWRGARDYDDERRVAAAEPRTAVEPVQVLAVTPYEGSRERHIHLLRKNGPTPNDLPRRPGMAAKRSFGSEAK
jgi:16S rRNA (guanine527-N7)-methyltransferase